MNANHKIHNDFLANDGAFPCYFDCRIEPDLISF